MMCQMLILQIKEKTDLIRLDLQSTTTIAITWCMLTVEDPVSSLSSGDLSAKDSGQSLTSPACAFPALLYIRAWKSHGFTMFGALDLGVIDNSSRIQGIINTYYKCYFWFGRFLNNNPGYIQDFALRCPPRPNSWRSGQSCWDGGSIPT